MVYTIVLIVSRDYFYNLYYYLCEYCRRPHNRGARSAAPLTPATEPSPASRSRQRSPSTLRAAPHPAAAIRQRSPSIPAEPPMLTFHPRAPSSSRIPRSLGRSLRARPQISHRRRCSAIKGIQGQQTAWRAWGGGARPPSTLSYPSAPRSPPFLSLTFHRRRRIDLGNLCPPTRTTGEACTTPCSNYAVELLL
jgi:hypothetical protein